VPKPVPGAFSEAKVREYALEGSPCPIGYESQQPRTNLTGRAPARQIWSSSVVLVLITCRAVSRRAHHSSAARSE